MAPIGRKCFDRIERCLPAHFGFCRRREDFRPDRRGSEDPLRSMRKDFFVDEIVHLLIGTAIANRIQLEPESGAEQEQSEIVR